MIVIPALFLTLLVTVCVMSSTISCPESDYMCFMLFKALLESEPIRAIFGVTSSIQSVAAVSDIQNFKVLLWVPPFHSQD